MTRWGGGNGNRAHLRRHDGERVRAHADGEVVGDGDQLDAVRETAQPAHGLLERGGGGAAAVHLAVKHRRRQQRGCQRGEPGAQHLGPVGAC